MKRAYREQAFNRLCADLESADFDVRENALFQLALMLRRSRKATPSADWTDFGSEDLPRELLRMRLSPADQERIVSHLERMLANYAESRASAFWALNEASAHVGFATVASAITEFGEQLNEEAAFQLCRALLLWLESDEVLAGGAIELLSCPGSLQVLGRWSRSTEARLAKSANALIKHAQRLSA